MGRWRHVFRDSRSPAKSFSCRETTSSGRAATDSYELFTRVLPQRVAALGWRWLQTDPFVSEKVAIVGSLGWYDYSFAQESLGIPRRFYEAKISPGAAERFDEYAAMFEPSDDIAPHAREVMARWNDGKFVSLHRSDVQFLDELLAMLQSQLNALCHHPHMHRGDSPVALSRASPAATLGAVGFCQGVSRQRADRKTFAGISECADRSSAGIVIFPPKPRSGTFTRRTRVAGITGNSCTC